MQIIPRFNPYTMTDDQVLKLQTGQESSLKWALSAIQNNQNQESSTHIAICGPHGSGKSFFMRRLQIHFKPYKTISCFLFPEFQTHIYHPDDFLISIQSFFSNEQGFKMIPQWHTHSSDNWQNNCDLLNKLLEKSPYNHLIVCIENLNLLLSNHGAFSAEADQLHLKFFLENSPWLTLVTTNSYSNLSKSVSAFFENFENHDLSMWKESDQEEFIKKMFRMNDVSADAQELIKFKALKRFTGGSPRNTVIMADILQHKHIFKTSHALESTIDILTPFYQHLLFEMQPNQRLLIDAIIRGGEPCSLEKLAHRLQSKESDIHASVLSLVNAGYLTSEKNKQDLSILYLTDRLFSHYYRMRHVHTQKRTGMLSVVSEFLTTFYDHQELKKYAEEFYWEGNLLISQDLMHITLSHAGLNVDLLPWQDDPPSLFMAMDLCQSNTYDPPKSEKKALFQRNQLLDLFVSTQYGPEYINKRMLGKNILGSLFLNEKSRQYLFKRCIQNKLSYDQWIDMDLYFALERVQVKSGYKDILIQLMDQMACGEIIPDVIRESSMNRLKNNDSEIYHVLIAFFSDRLPFEMSSSDQYESHKICLNKMAKSNDYKAFHLEQMGWHKGCLKQFTEANKYFQQALDIRKKNGQIKRIAWIFGQMGWCYQSLKDYDLSLQFHENACEYYTRVEDLISMAWNIGCIGRIYGKNKQYEIAIKKHHEALRLLEQQKDTVLSGWNWSRIARNLTRLKRYDEAMNAHQKAMTMIENEKNKDLEAWNLEGMAWIYGKINQYDDAITTQQKALKYRSQEGNISQQAWNLEGIGWSLGKLGRYEEALKVLNRALKIREKTDHISGQAWNLEGIARHLGNLGNHDESIVAHERALVLQKKNKNIERQIWNFRGIAWNYKEISNYEQSIKYLKKALKESEKSDNSYWQAALWGLIGWDLRRTHRVAEAIHAHEKAITFFKAQKNSSAIQENAGQIAINYFILGQTGRAWHVLDHYGQSIRLPKKLMARIADAVIYLEKNVRKETAFKTGTNILDGIWYRRKQWDESYLIQCFFLSLIKAGIDIYFIQRLVHHMQKRCGNSLNTEFEIIVALIKYIYSGKNRQHLAKMNPEQRQAVEALIDALGVALANYV
ncbi:hypothetical protein MHK_010981 [Candidatus Magnetomorum sp. HK-1]|nr:hypothetical protein MHK_010981 [Candidatus Magnetomorum sp. HK-1]